MVFVECGPYTNNIAQLENMFPYRFCGLQLHQIRRLKSARNQIMGLASIMYTVVSSILIFFFLII